ncbi:MAG: N(4)-(beta-N-acetylglucosaminyl)-L-asparaginase [bacterium]
MEQSQPLILATWDFGREANQAGWEILARGGTALDAVEAAARAVENDPEVPSVGYGGYPNEMGVVQLDAAIIDGKTGRMGAVAALEGIRNPISVARRVLEKNKHIFLVGAGAQSFALKEGFHEENLNTPKSVSWYAEQLQKKPADPGHDTVGVLARDARGGLAVACSTSGLALKWSGRVGDSPLIGAGLYLDQAVGGAVGTGVGERAIEVCGAFAIVEFMRYGLSPQKACEQLLRRVAERNKDRLDFQLAFIAMNREGEIGAASLQEGFVYAARDATQERSAPGAVFGKDFP